MRRKPIHHPLVCLIPLRVRRSAALAPRATTADRVSAVVGFLHDDLNLAQRCFCRLHQPRHVRRGLLLSHPLTSLPENGTLRSCGCTPYLVLSAQRLECAIIVGGTLAYVLGARPVLCGLLGEVGRIA